MIVKIEIEIPDHGEYHVSTDRADVNKIIEAIGKEAERVIKSIATFKATNAKQ